MKRNIAAWTLLVAWSAFGGDSLIVHSAQAQDSAQQSIAKRIGTVKAVNGSTLTLDSSGSEVAINVESGARILQLAPGAKDLKSATPLQLQDLKVGDTIRARGASSADGKSLAALEVIVITHAAVAAVSDQLRQDWQKRGAGGRVESVDDASGDVVVAIPTLSGKKTLLVHTNTSTVVYRYAPESPKPEDAKPSGVKDIQSGDQLRARGNRNPDGSEMSAEEIFAGVFPQFAATVKSVDASEGILSVQDLVSKKTVQIKVTPDSQVHKIPPEMAQGFAMRLKGAMPGAGQVAPAGAAAPKPAANTQVYGPPGGIPPGGGMGGGGVRNGGAPDLQRMLSRMPSSTLADLNLQKGDAVIILATEGTPNGPHTAITLLSGVEPILQAVPGAGQAMMLTPWSLGGAPGGDASQ
ncbi:MAG TPA: hypothetical protein VKB49_29925 [Candidatus Sulfotelmatobacter sp.]|nr:hypothetical protein [Candidatus Sulfotelmatobacter sp.]